MVLYHDIFGNKELFVTVDNLVLLEPFMYLTKKDPINNINTTCLDEERNKVSSSISKPRSSVDVTELRSVKSTDDETIELVSSVPPKVAQGCGLRPPTESAKPILGNQCRKRAEQPNTPPLGVSGYEPKAHIQSCSMRFTTIIGLCRKQIAYNVSQQ